MVRVTEIRRLADCTISLRQSAVLYAVGADADLEHWRTQAGEVALQLSGGLTVALMSEADIPDGVDRIGLRQWNAIAYMGDGKAILAWPLHSMENQLSWLKSEWGRATEKRTRNAGGRRVGRTQR
jgi:hypothetical protein